MIDEYARNALIEEVIAFANAHGGTLIVGIRETKDKPARADDIAPLPACHDLAEIFRLQCRDIIEPQLPVLEVAGVAADDEGNGLLVVRVPRSRLAPHRHAVTKECYIRRADRTEKMTMREIQDLTLNVERGMAAIEARFEECRKIISDMEWMLPNNRSHAAWVLNVTLVPLSPIGVDRVYNAPEVRPCMYRFKDKSGDLEFFNPLFGSRAAPVLRGASIRHSDDDTNSSMSVFCDGVVNYRFRVDSVNEDDTLWVFPTWIVATIASAICNAHAFRLFAKAPTVEYGLEMLIDVRGSDVSVAGYSDRPRSYLGTLDGHTHLFPRYCVADPAKLSELIGIIERDFWDLVGRDRGAPINIDLSPVIGDDPV